MNSLRATPQSYSHPAARQPARMQDHGCSVRSKRLLKPMLSYIPAFIKAAQAGLW
jgi:hypothetical protein